jgi:SEC-C motif-containing protein
MTVDKMCPCGSGRPLSSCCGPVIDDPRSAATAEALMRSRYTAHVLGRWNHLWVTWHPRTRPDLVEEDGLRWTGLEVVRVEEGDDAVAGSGAPASGGGASASGGGAPASGRGAPASGSGASASGRGAPASGSGASASGTVEYRASYREGKRPGVLHEVARFQRRAGRWFYVDGDVLDA